jgi:hypothetical protein
VAQVFLTLEHRALVLCLTYELVPHRHVVVPSLQPVAM